MGLALACVRIIADIQALGVAPNRSISLLLATILAQQLLPVW
jgi:hypothetical protein